MSVYYQDDTLTLLTGDARKLIRDMPDGSVNCIVTSPPYFGLRDYHGNPDQIGLEQSPAEYVEKLTAVFREARRVLADDGTLWLNLGDSYSTYPGNRGASTGINAKRRGEPWPDAPRGSGLRPPKNLLGIPWRVAFALQDDGWILRNAIVWNKPNATPESVTDRLSNRHELLFLFSKSRRYWFDLDPIREPLARPEALSEGTLFGGNNGGTGKIGSSARRGGSHKSVYGNVPPGRRRPKNGGTGDHHSSTHERGRNPGDVWSISTRPFAGAHFATFPVELPRRCILAGCRPGGTVLDPFSGAGTTALAAQELGRKAIGIDINPEYHDIALRRMSDAPLPFGEVSGL